MVTILFYHIYSTYVYHCIEWLLCFQYYFAYIINNIYKKKKKNAAIILKK